jgi:hypothetical protein
MAESSSENPTSNPLDQGTTILQSARRQHEVGSSSQSGESSAVSSEVSSLRYETFPPGNGLMFTEMSEHHRSLLKEFLGCEEARIFGSSSQSAE